MPQATLLGPPQTIKTEAEEKYQLCCSPQEGKVERNFCKGRSILDNYGQFCCYGGLLLALSCYPETAIRNPSAKSSQKQILHLSFSLMAVKQEGVNTHENE